jgi:thiol-disulfide isomerase/thioredoxin
MALLVAAVTFVGLLGLLDLALTIGVVRRLREHSALLGRRSPFPLGEAIAPAGGTIGDFAALSADGEPVRRDLLADRTLVGFFAPDCAPCREMVPKFIAYATDVPGGRQRALAVVVGESGAAAEYVAALESVASVVVEPLDGPLAVAFRVRGFPALAIVDADGTVLDSGVAFEDLAAALA